MSTDPQRLSEQIEAVVIGGSAGAIDALGALFPRLPAKFHPAILVVVHLPRGRPSLLTEIFAARCSLRMREAEDKLPIQAGTVYFAPPDYHLLVDSGRQLALSSDEMVHFSRPSIDVLFESAADEYGDRLMGVLLSGANQDGADGLASVARAGGVTVVQSPETAMAAEMGQAALQLIEPDFVLPLDEIVMLLLTLRSG